MDADVLADIRMLKDIEEIRRLRAKYAYGANVVEGQCGDLKAFGELFAEDGKWDVGLGIATGPSEVEAVMRQLTARWRTAMHYMINPLIEVKGDHGRGTCTGLFAFTTYDNARPIWLSIIYTDSYVRTPAGWRFQSVAGLNTIADPDYLKIYADFATFSL